MSKQLEALADKITEVQTINIGKDEVLVIKVKDAEHGLTSEADLAKVFKDAKEVFGDTKLLVCSEDLEFVKVSLEQAKLIDILKG